VSGPCRVAILIGFDRSGSSMVSRLLARHPRVNLLFQPFNSTEVHRAQWKPWAPDHRSPATEAFLESLLEGELDASYLASDWFAKHSSSASVDPDGINLVKDTKLHFQVEWLKQRFPSIELLGLWRDPRGITCSLVRNDFHRTWYGDAAFRAVDRLLEERPELERFRALRAECSNDLRRMALGVAVRTDALFRALDRDRRIVYEDVVRDPEGELNRVAGRFGLEPFPFGAHAGEDFNVAGAPFLRADLWRERLPAEELGFLDRLFALVEGS
jgi:hypothetical protein